MKKFKVSCDVLYDDTDLLVSNEKGAYHTATVSVTLTEFVDYVTDEPVYYELIMCEFDDKGSLEKFSRERFFTLELSTEQFELHVIRSLSFDAKEAL